MMKRFKSIWLVDFEFEATDGECSRPICMVAREHITGETIRVFERDLWSLEGPPYGIGAGSLMVAYFASAELGCHLALNWPLPENVLDLYAEFRIRSSAMSFGSSSRGEEWSSCDTVSQYRSELLVSLPLVGPVRLMTTVEENTAHDALPELVTIYRGCDSCRVSVPGQCNGD